MRIENEVKLDFCDVLIKPKRSEAPSRSKVDLTRTYKFLNSKTIWSGTPIIAANMDTTGTFSISKVMSQQGMLTCLHKYYSLESLIDFYSNEFVSKNVFYTLGIKNNDLEKLDAFSEGIKHTS